MAPPEKCDECGSTNLKKVVIAKIPTGPMVIGGSTPLMELAVYQCRECKNIMGPR